jgi:hypothetical protein
MSTGDSVRRYDEERLGELLRLLPPAPEGWVLAAQELPSARAGIDTLVERAKEDQAFRAALLADIEAALAAEGVEPSRPLVDLLRRRVAE